MPQFRSFTQPRPDALVDYEWLTGSQAIGWLDLANQWDGSTVALAARLRTELSQQRTHLILEQIGLRRRAREKFGAAERMFFTPLGLEQATDEEVARYKAARFGVGVPVADLCSGIGGDLIELAQRGAVIGVDRNPVVACLAVANAAAVLGDARQAGQVELRSQEASGFAVSGLAGWHIDPDRRSSGRRTTNVALSDPLPVVIDGLLADCPDAAIKLAPAALLPDHWPLVCELEWISRKRQCRQLVAWFGRLARYPGQRRATVLDPLSGEPHSIIGDATVTAPVAERMGRYLFEPDPAVLAAGLSGTLADQHRLAAVGAEVAYFTGDQPVDDPAMAAFEIVEVLPYRLKPLREWLRVRGIGRLEVKKRGAPIEPQEVRRQLQLSGDAEATLLIARIGANLTAIVARRLPGRMRRSRQILLSRPAP